LADFWAGQIFFLFLIFFKGLARKKGLIKVTIFTDDWLEPGAVKRYGWATWPWRRPAWLIFSF
jgi:hypothetical protein